MNILGIKYIGYDSIRKILFTPIKTRFENKLYDTELKIRIVREIEMVNTLISANIKKYLLMLNNSDKIIMKLISYVLVQIKLSGIYEKKY